MKSISEIRRDYQLKSLNESDVLMNPTEQFQTWLTEAVNANVSEPTAMILATSTPDGRPSARVVLLKKMDEKGFVFFTNYNSRKGSQLSRNPFAAMVFFWPELERQVRIEGTIEKISAEESDEYFLSRPEGSKLGAWASPQSQKIPDRDYLESMVLKYQSLLGDKISRRPENWGGYRMKPFLVEFWQGRANRLHDRIQYKMVNNIWKIERLAP